MPFDMWGAAGLKAQYQSLKAKHELESEEQKLKHRIEEFEIQIQMAMAATKSRVYEEQSVLVMSGLNPQWQQMAYQAEPTPAPQAASATPLPMHTTFQLLHPAPSIVNSVDSQ